MDWVAVPLEALPGGEASPAVGLFRLDDLSALAGLWRDAEARGHGFAALLAKYLAGHMVRADRVGSPGLRRALEEVHGGRSLRLMPLEAEALLEEPEATDRMTLVLGSITPTRGFLGLFFCERWPEARLLAFHARADLEKVLRG